MTQTTNNKKPLECSNIAEVRAEIDRIDKAIIGLLGERFGYVKEVVKYKKPTPEGIVAQDRRMAVLESRRQWAKENGLNPNVIEEIYDRLISYFIDEEMKVMNNA